MLWLLIPVVGIIGKVIFDAATEEKPQQPPSKPKIRIKSKLELNLDRLKKELKSQSGEKIAIIGQPGAGKSSLLKEMTKGKIFPLPIIGIQTDATDWSSDTQCNLISHYKNYTFSDVPGYDTQSHPLKTFTAKFPFKEFDSLIFVIHGKIYGADEEIFQLIAKSGSKFLIARSFSENLEKHEKEVIEENARNKFNADKSIPFIFFSNRNGSGINEINRLIK